MKIDLTEIAREPGAHASQEFEEPLAGDPDVELVEPARGSFSVTNTGRLLVVRGQVSAEVRLQCARCLDDVVLKLEIPLSEEFSAKPASESSDEQTIDIEEPERAAFHENILDLTELVRQNIMIQLPLQPLCREDCAGICPQCGRNLNVDRCECPPPEPHSALAGLRRRIESRE